MQNLAQKKCIACEDGTTPLNKAEATILLQQLSEWKLSLDAGSLLKTFAFKNFKQALAFGNQVGEIAEQEGHHPDLLIAWGKVDITLSTHAIKGLSENDFILASKIDRL